MKYKICVPVSGGVDSQACLKLAIELHGADNVIGLFCDTKFEHPLTYQHIEFMRELYGVRIDSVNEGDVLSKCSKYKRFPSGTARFCTDELKIKPSIKYYKQLAEKQGGFEVWYGIRGDEGHERRKRYQDKISDELYLPHEYMSKYPKYLGKMGVRIRLPILEMNRADIVEIVGNEANPLYAAGSDRVGCFPCLAGGDKSKEKAFQMDEFGRSQYEKVKMLDEQIGAKLWRSKGHRYKYYGIRHTINEAQKELELSKGDRYKYYSIRDTINEAQEEFELSNGAPCAMCNM